MKKRISKDEFSKIIRELMESETVMTKNLCADSEDQQDTEAEPVANMRITDHSVIVEIVMPGFSKDEISLFIKDDKLVVKAEKDAESEKDGFLAFSEFVIPSIKRTFNINTDSVDITNVNSSLENGILFVEFLKKDEEETPEIINIEIA